MGLKFRFSSKARRSSPQTAGSGREYTSFYMQTSPERSVEDLLGMYGEFMLEHSTLGNFLMDEDDDDDYNPATGSSGHLPAVDAEFSDVDLESPQSVNGWAYNLLRGYEDIYPMTPTADPVASFTNDVQSLGFDVMPRNLDVMFDAEDPDLGASEQTHGDPGAAFAVAPALVAAQPERIGAEDEVDCSEPTCISLPGRPTEVTVARENDTSAVEHFSGVSMEQASREHESHTHVHADSGSGTSQEIQSPTSQVYFRPLSKDQCVNAQDVQWWDPATRDLLIEIYEGASSIRTVPLSTAPNPGLTVDTGVQNPFLGMSALLWRRVLRDAVALARQNEYNESSFFGQMVEADVSYASLTRLIAGQKDAPDALDRAEEGEDKFQNFGDSNVDLENLPSEYLLALLHPIILVEDHHPHISTRRNLLASMTTYCRLIAHPTHQVDEGFLWVDAPSMSLQRARSPISSTVFSTVSRVDRFVHSTTSWMVVICAVNALQGVVPDSRALSDSSGATDVQGLYDNSAHESNCISGAGSTDLILLSLIA
ncbi:uncharacterized protein EI97DRAFT_446074 [Westerdykella ornata]|uniref:Uncharacterized protein n=1 Tax=Westerdykella ornata TaxID=318751 RepID=A0A6A6J6P8_WESOR|nr:uncharacterized protein EI97DRAFT_446074 [Westerdykella ornata]KAF2272082.1 hypothetical protein EI97DRAFT_446074 [Westerdykella ornata]